MMTRLAETVCNHGRSSQNVKKLNKPARVGGVGNEVKDDSAPDSIRIRDLSI